MSNEVRCIKELNKDGFTIKKGSEWKIENDSVTTYMIYRFPNEVSFRITKSEVANHFINFKDGVTYADIIDGLVDIVKRQDFIVNFDEITKTIEKIYADKVVEWTGKNDEWQRETKK